MEKIFWATELYDFLRYCDESPLTKSVLDCGAGGWDTTLSLFYKYGFKTFGIEIAEHNLKKALDFCAENDLQLNIFRGDMRFIPFPNESFPFAYAYNAIYFMNKPDILIAMKEITRVLKHSGLCYVNFLLVEDTETWEPFDENAVARRLLKSEGFAHFEDNEADMYFDYFDVLRKVKKWRESLVKGKISRRVEVEYIARKK